jgi:hypothetical protein
MPNERIVRCGTGFLDWAAGVCSAAHDREQVGFWFVRSADEAAGIYESCEHLLITTSSLLRQRADRVVPDPLSLIWACRHARAARMTLFLVHSHIGSTARFSRVDEAAERMLAPRVMQLSGSSAFGAVVIAGRTYSARVWEGQVPCLLSSSVRIVP